MANKTVNIDLIVNLKSAVKTVSTVKNQFDSLGESVESVNNSLVLVNKTGSKIGTHTFESLPTVKNQFDSLGKSVKPVNTGLNKLKNETANTTNAVINFNRVIQDSPYGIIGVANNIDPLVQSFLTLRRTTNGTGNAIKSLLKSAFTGPGALITVFSLASTAAVFFSMKMRGAGSASKEAEESIKEQIKAVNDLNKAYNKLAGFSLGQGIQQEIDLIDEALKLKDKQLEKEEDLRIVRRAGNRSSNEFNKKFEKEIELYGSKFKAQQALKKEIKEEIANYDVLIQRLGFEETKLDDLTEKREDAVKKLEAYNNAQSENAQLAKLVQETQAEVNQTLDSYTAKVEGSDTAVVELAASLTSQINKFRELANEGDTEVIPVIVALQKEFDKLQKATEFDVTEILPDSSFYDELRPKVEAVKDEFLELSQIDLDNLINVDFGNVEGSIADLQDKIRELKQAQLQSFSTEGVDAFQQQINALQAKIDALTNGIKNQKTAWDGLSSSLGNAIGQQILYAESAKDAGKQIIKTLTAEIVTRAILSAFNPPTPASFALAPIFAGLATKLVSSLIPGFADGGLITGAGGEREDKILARLSNGEFVVNAASTRQNLPLLKAINEGNTESMFSEVVRESNTQSVDQIGSTQPDLVSDIREAFGELVLPKINGKIDNDVIRLSFNESIERLDRNTIQI